jgi:hypothetical protein
MVGCSVILRPGGGLVVTGVVEEALNVLANRGEPTELLPTTPSQGS